MLFKRSAPRRAACPTLPTGMAKEIPGIGDLRRKAEITDAEIQAVTDAYPKGENAEPFTFKSGHGIDAAKATEGHHPVLGGTATQLTRLIYNS